MSDVFGALEGLSAAGNLLGGATRAGVAYVIWGFLHDDELDSARAAMASLARMRPSGTRRQCVVARSSEPSDRRRPSSRALRRVDGEFRSIRVAVTPQDLVLLDDWNHDPETELARLPRRASRMP